MALVPQGYFNQGGAPYGGGYGGGYGAQYGGGYGPQYAPQHVPQYAPQHVPQYGPQYGGGYGGGYGGYPRPQPQGYGGGYGGGFPAAGYGGGYHSGGFPAQVAHHGYGGYGLPRLDRGFGGFDRGLDRGFDRGFGDRFGERLVGDRFGERLVGDRFGGDAGLGYGSFLGREPIRPSFETSLLRRAELDLGERRLGLGREDRPLVDKYLSSSAPLSALDESRFDMQKPFSWFDDAYSRGRRMGSEFDLPSRRGVGMDDYRPIGRVGSDDVSDVLRRHDQFRARTERERDGDTSSYLRPLETSARSPTSKYLPYDDKERVVMESDPVFLTEGKVIGERALPQGGSNAPAASGDGGAEGAWA